MVSSVTANTCHMQPCFLKEKITDRIYNIIMPFQLETYRPLCDRKFLSNISFDQSDFDLNPMTLVLKLDLDMVKINKHFNKANNSH